MVPFEEAISLTMKHVVNLPTERIEFTAAQGRILAEDICADTDMPPFNKSAMDGYACRFEDIKNPLQVVETIPAGTKPSKTITQGTCAKIMTGAPVPEGADCVIVVEKTKELGRNFIEYLEDQTSKNICLKGEDIRAGDLVLKKGTLIRPQEMAVIASVGHAKVLVSKAPLVGVISTGTELYAPGASLAEGAIRDSNSYQLTAQVEKMGAEGVNYGVAIDTPEDIRQAIQTLEKTVDVIILSGGVSMGDYDLVPGELQNAGYKAIFHGVMVKPGRPLLFGVKDKKCCFGLPGNPVSTFVQFEYIIKPFLYKMMGHEFRVPSILLPLADKIKIRKTDRDSIIPVVIADGKLNPVDYHGSAHINALPGAHGLIRILRGIDEVKKGELVDVRLI